MSNNEKLISLCLFLKILSSLFILWRKLLGDKSIGLGAIGLKQMAKFKIQSIFCQLRLQVTTWGRVISLKPLLCAIIIIVWNNYHHYCVKQKSQKGKVTKLSDPRCWKFLDDVQFSYLPYPQTSHNRKILTKANKIWSIPWTAGANHLRSWSIPEWLHPDLRNPR